MTEAVTLDPPLPKQETVVPDTSINFDPSRIANLTSDMRQKLTWWKNAWSHGSEEAEVRLLHNDQYEISHVQWRDKKFGNIEIPYVLWQKAMGKEYTGKPLWERGAPTKDSKPTVSLKDLQDQIHGLVIDGKPRPTIKVTIASRDDDTAPMKKETLATPTPESHYSPAYDRAKEEGRDLFYVCKEGKERSPLAALIANGRGEENTDYLQGGYSTLADKLLNKEETQIRAKYLFRRDNETEEKIQSELRTILKTKLKTKLEREWKDKYVRLFDPESPTVQTIMEVLQDLQIPHEGVGWKDIVSENDKLTPDWREKYGNI